MPSKCKKMKESEKKKKLEYKTKSGNQHMNNNKIWEQRTKCHIRRNWNKTNKCDGI